MVDRFLARFREREWPGERLPQVYYDPRSLAAESARRASLHAKCVVIDRSTAFISSANFTAAAQERNIEVGVILRQGDIPDRLARHFLTLIEQGVLVEVRG